MDVLYFHLDGAPYAFLLPAVADVAPAGPIQRVPLAPRAILGLAESRGRAIAVIDLPSLLNATSARRSGPACLMRLAGPLHGTAFLVPSTIFCGRAMPADAEHVFIDGHLHVLLDPEELMKRAGAFD